MAVRLFTQCFSDEWVPIWGGGGDICKMTNCVLDGRWREQDSQEESRVAVSILYCGTISLQIGRMTRKFGLTPDFHPYRKLREWLCPIEDQWGLRTPGAYKSPCSCGLDI